MAEDPQPQSIQQRIAALNHAHVGRMPGDPLIKSRPTSTLPSNRPALSHRQQTANSVTNTSIGNEPNGLRQNGILPPPVITRTGQKTIDKPKPAPPPLPLRRDSSQPSPALPPRRPSEQASRRDSLESTSSVISSVSGISALSNGTAKTSASRSTSMDSSRVKAPAWGEVALPPLPPKRADQPKQAKVHEVRAPLATTKSTPAIVTTQEVTPPPVPSLPPRLPPRKESNVQTRDPSPPPSTEPVRKLPPAAPSAVMMEKIKKSALSFGLNKPTEETPALSNGKPTTNEISHVPEIPASATPPPIPLASRPDLSKLQATKPRPHQPAATNIPDTICMKCRDFSGPDNHATRFPRQSVPSQDLSWLALQLTSPFPSPTDKARAIFAWLHHNIRYDVDAFFNDRVQPSTPASTFATGLAVCEGYAGLFTALATYAGLESVVISGHGKGYGYTPLPPGATMPPFSSNHAWNVVKIDDGAWKLIDSCWGAGHVGGKGQPYQQRFEPNHFNISNNEFGLKHYPTNKNQFFRDDGRPSISWEEYIRTNPDQLNGVEPPTVFSNAKTDHSIGERTVMPAAKKISVRQEGTTRFQFGLLCPHWTLEKHTKKGPPPVFLLGVHGVDGRKDDQMPFEHVRGLGDGGGGDYWYCDLDAGELGAPGQKLSLWAVTSFGGRQDARGLSVREFKEGKGRMGMGFAGIAEWELV